MDGNDGGVMACWSSSSRLLSRPRPSAPLNEAFNRQSGLRFPAHGHRVPQRTEREREREREIFVSAEKKKEAQLGDGGPCQIGQMQTETT